MGIEDLKPKDGEEKLNKNEEMEKEDTTESEINELLKLYPWRDENPAKARAYAEELFKAKKISEQREKELEKKHPDYYKNAMCSAVLQRNMEKKEIEEMFKIFKKFAPDKPSVPGSWFGEIFLQYINDKKFIEAWIEGYDKEGILTQGGVGVVDPEKGEYWEDLSGFSEIVD